MSFIHCSPLFTPLMPLPIMPREVMRKERKESTSSATNPSKGAMKPPPRKGKTAPKPIKAKGKQPATSSCTSQPTAQLPAFVGPSQTYRFQPQYTGHLTTTQDVVAATHQDDPEHEMDVNLDFLYSEDLEEQPHLSNASSFKEGSYDSDVQVGLTFTIESQPMCDLSSSQQQDR